MVLNYSGLPNLAMSSLFTYLFNIGLIFTFVDLTKAFKEVSRKTMAKFGRPE